MNNQYSDDGSGKEKGSKEMVGKFGRTSDSFLCSSHCPKPLLEEKGKGVDGALSPNFALSTVVSLLVPAVPLLLIGGGCYSFVFGGFG